MDKPITLGTITGGILAETAPNIIIDSPELKPHVGRPWLTKYIEQRLGQSIRPVAASDQSGHVLSVPEDMFKRSCLIVGAPGGGKTRLAAHLLGSLLERGFSAIMLDVQEKSISMGLAQAVAAGLAPEQITVLSPKDVDRGVPGLNPFAVPWDEVVGAADSFVDLLRESKSSWGVALDDLLRCTSVVVAAQQLSPFELLRAIQREDLRLRLLERARHTGAWERFPEQHEYVAREFRDRGETAPAAANKLRGILTNPFLRRLMIARRDTLDLAGHWQRQRFTAVHLDTALGDDATQLLSGILTHRLYREAMVKSGPHSVCLMVDELGLQSRYCAEALSRMLYGLRQRGLFVVAACQHLDQVPEKLRTALLATALRVSFRVEAHDAAVVAGSLGIGTSTRPERLALTAGKEFKRFRYWITDAESSHLKLSRVAWERVMTVGPGARQLRALKAAAALAGIGRLYVQADGRLTELSRFTSGVPEHDVILSGPDGLQVSIRFPCPTIKVLASRTAAQRREEAEALLQSLPVQHAVVRTDIGESFTIRVVDVPTCALPNPSDFLGNGQSAPEIRDVENWRRELVEGTSRKTSRSDLVQEDDDGNL